MTASEYNASIHLQVTLRCIAWLLLSCCVLLPLPHVVLPLTTGFALNMTVGEYNASIHLEVITFQCVVVVKLRFSSPPPMLVALHNWEYMEHDRE